MRIASAYLLTLSLCGLASAGPPTVVEVPRDKPGEWHEIKAAPGRILRLGAEPASKWLLVDEEGADLLPADGGKVADFASPTPGRFKLIVTSPDGTPARVVVVVGDQPPGPGPKPNPPADPLKAKLKAAYDGDTDPKKSDHAKDLAALYREASKLSGNAEVATAADLLQRVRAASKSLVGDDALKSVRQAVGQELALLFPADGPLADDQRKKAASLFTRLAEILDGLGG